MIERLATIRNEQGIHCRPSAKIVTEASKCPSQIRVFAEAGEADLRSLLSLVSLGLQEGTTIRVQVSGGDEATVCDRIVELFETKYDFPPLSTDGRNMMMDSLVAE
ncbi:MAG: HPr family phosphocarrier protein [bacterium]